MPRKSGGQHPPESTQKSHECERNMAEAHASTRGERRAPRLLGSRGPLKRFRSEDVVTFYVAFAKQSLLAEAEK